MTLATGLRLGPYEILGQIYAALGQRDEAFALLDRAVQDRSGKLFLIEGYPEFDPLRSDPRYAKLLSRIGLPPPKR